MADIPAWQAPPLTVTASSSPTETRRQDTGFADEKDEDRDDSQSRISDHIETPRRNKDRDDDSDDDSDEDDRRKKNKNRKEKKKKKRRTQDSDAGENTTGKRRNAYRRYLQDPGLKWHKEYSALDVKSGRVLMIDYARSGGKTDKSRSHMRKVSAQEVFNIHALHKFYRTQQGVTAATEPPAMRVIHVQNADWAVPFLLRKFNIASRSSHDENVGADFGRYLQYKKPEIRGGKPFLVGKTWRVQYDPFRGVNKTSFGLDYMKGFSVRRGNRAREESEIDRVMQLNDFDDNDEPIYSHDVYAQRLSCYIQHRQAPSENNSLSRDQSPPRRRNFYPPDAFGAGDNKDDDPANGPFKNKQYRVRNYDNGNVIIIFDNSFSGSFDDTLIPARRELECRWRRLPFLLAFESRDPIEDDDNADNADAKLALNCSKSILSDIFKALAMNWAVFLDHAVTHMNILEDKVYDRPDDESRAPELWVNSSAWLKVEKLVNVHISVMQEMKARLHELTDDVDSEDNWLEDSPGDFERLTNMVTEDLTKPTESLISLLYQSVSIRDSRHSLELGLSMWRLSWITFVFLPLTFIVGFFGMNVDTFQNNPSIKWYFIAAIPFMVGVIGFYFFIKRGSSYSRPSPHERAVYESFFQQMAATNPTLWSRNGPRDYVHVDGRIARMKWSLIKHWIRRTNLNSSNNNSSNSMTVAATSAAAALTSDAEDTISGRALLQGDGLGTLSRIQRYLTRRWTRQISRRATTTMETTDTEMGLMNLNSDFEDLTSISGDERFSGDHTTTAPHNDDNFHSIGEGLTEIAGILSAPAAPTSGHPGVFSSSSAPSSVDHDQDHTNITTHLTVPGALARTVSSSAAEPHDASTDTPISNPMSHVIVAAALSRQHRQRLRSSSSPSSSARRPHSSGSSPGRTSRTSGMLVEEEDAEWLNERGRKGKDWFWRRSLSSRGSSGERD
ncbi:hypothetical protein UA08_02012 [Talaromyces atroroseus]|uniref:Uncharacterized protein n=1 Tax=Talaromyces atroroseus TaxID=1441469 RepID=A0A1Q5QCD4_TALAT|nr:hypothetical protein UA08_02012 [Talaromyces atroroseus]OKL63593.1 hypothetical protein UA08_02012 [Talaromyces atroroseus]